MLPGRILLVQKDGIAVGPVVLMRISGEHGPAVHADFGCAEACAAGIFEYQNEDFTGYCQLKGSGPAPSGRIQL